MCKCPLFFVFIFQVLVCSRFDIANWIQYGLKLSNLIRTCCPPYQVLQLRNFPFCVNIASYMAEAIPVMGLGRLQPSHPCVIKAGFYPRMSVRDDAKICSVRNKSFQACQEPSPCLFALTLNNGKCEWINLVVSICCHCYQQLPFILAIEVRCIDAYHRPTILEPFYTRTKSPKGTVKCASSQHTTMVAL